MTTPDTALFDSRHPVAGAPIVASPYDDLLDQATSRLLADPELQLEVRQELKGHLQDAAAEHLAAGSSAAQSHQLARSALGDPRQLSDDLFHTHRRRLVQRRVLKWTLALALIPAALAITFSVGFSALLSAGVYASQKWAGDRDQLRPLLHAVNHLSEASFDRLLAELKRDDRLIADAAASAKLYRPPAQWANSARRLLARWPQNRAYFAYSASADFKELVFASRGMDPAAVSTFLQKMDRGKQLDPDNALYNVLKANVLFDLSSTLIDVDIARSAMPADERSLWKGMPIRGVEIRDQATFNRALGELRAGWHKPYLTDYADVVAGELRAIHRPDGLAQVLQMQPIRSYGGGRRSFMFATAYALQLARQQTTSADQTTVLQLLDGAAKIARLLARGEPSYRDAWTSGEVLRYRIASLRLMGQADAAATARAELMVQEKLAYELQKQAYDPTQLETLERKIENAVRGRLAIGLWLAILIVIASALLLILCASTIRDRFHSLSNLTNSDRPTLGFVFIGWRRLLRVCILAVIIPLLVGLGGPLLYSASNPGGTVGFSMTFALSAFAIAMLLLSRLTKTAIRDRAAELGVEAPPTPTPNQLARPFTLLSLTLLGATTFLLIIAFSLDALPTKGPIILERWAWIPCAVPLYWIVSTLIRRYYKFASHRSAVIGTFVVVLVTSIFAGPLSDQLVSLASLAGLSLPECYLLGAALFAAFISSRLLISAGIMHSPSHRRRPAYRPMHRLLAASALPAVGCTILLVALFAGYPLRYFEAQAAHELDNAMMIRANPSRLSSP